MEDNIFTLKSDIQQAIVSNIDLKSNYRLLFYDKFNMILLNALACFENLKIFPQNSLMRFEGEIAKDLTFNENEINGLKKKVWKDNMQNLVEQMKNDKKSEYQRQNEKLIAEIKLDKLLDECENQDLDFRKPTQEEKNTLKNIQRQLNSIGLNLDYEEHKEILMLAGNFEYLKFTKQELRFFFFLIVENNLDNFLIAPVYDEDNEYDENCKAIRIVMTIDLAKE